MSLAHIGFELVTKRTLKREFLDETNLVIQWTELLTLIAPHAPAGKTGRTPFSTEMMLRIYLLQQFFGHSAPALEEAFHDIPLYREFAHWMLASHACPVRATFGAFATCSKNTGWGSRYWLQSTPS